MSNPAKRLKRGDAAAPTINLRCLGFCGADDSVEPTLLAAISAQHPWVEWGVLFRKDKEGLPKTDKINRQTVPHLAIDNWFVGLRATQGCWYAGAQGWLTIDNGNEQAKWVAMNGF